MALTALKKLGDFHELNSDQKKDSVAKSTVTLSRA